MVLEPKETDTEFQKIKKLDIIENIFLLRTSLINNNHIYLFINIIIYNKL